jgi:hypothetical protein
VWTYCDSNDPAHWKENITCGCYLGDTSSICPSTTHSKIKWQGGRRTTKWVPPQPSVYSTADFNDSSWAQINVPHDFVIERDFTPTAASNHGYLPRDEPGWYRKKFNIPVEFAAAGVKVWLRFNGVYHTR